MIKINTEDIINYHKLGFNFHEISNKLNCSVSTMRRRLKKDKIDLKHKNINIDQLIDLYNKKIKIIDIAKYFNCSIPTIRLKINENKIKLNTEKIYFLPQVGQKFNRLKFICEDESKHNKKRWKCECECGKIKSYDYYNVIKGTTKSCGCYHRDDVKNYNWSGYENIPGRYWNSIMRGANKRNIKFEITIEYAWYIYEKQNRRCNLSNLQIEFETKNNKIKNFQASLDRINNEKGYIEGNIQWIVKEINYMKNKLDESNFIDLCKSIINNHKKQ